jgi:hypothetical protein
MSYCPLAWISAAASIFWFLPPATAQETKFPTGTFTGYRVSRRAPHRQLWLVKFGDDGKFTVMRGEEVSVKGTYKLKGNEIEFRDENGPSLEDYNPGTYRWMLTDGKLKFTKIRDEAKGRATQLTSSPWSKQER